MDRPVMVYLAEPVDQAPDRSRLAVEAAGLLWGAGWSVYQPRQAWAGGRLPEPRIQQLNQHALDETDLVVAILPTGVPTIGVPLEIMYATARDAPAIVHTPAMSQALAGMPGVHQIQDLGELLPLARRLLGRTRPAPDTGQLRLVLRDGHGMPRRAFPDDAGIDLTCTEAVTVEPGTFVDIATQVVGVQTPPDSWLMVTGRSSTLRKRRLHIPVAVIDPGWRGPLYVGVWNLSHEPVKVEAGDRLAQIILIHNRTAQITLAQVHELAPHERGLNGFGSTG
jgi:dUTP pyrophosphatase